MLDPSFHPARANTRLVGPIKEPSLNLQPDNYIQYSAVVEKMKGLSESVCEREREWERERERDGGRGDLRKRDG